MLGSNLAHYFKDNYDVLGLYNTHPVEIDGICVQQVDISSAVALTQVIGEFHPDIIIHCASLTDIDYCETSTEKTNVINVLGVRNIVECVQNSNIKIIYISSDSVYEGDVGNYSESDLINPQNYYGLSKYEGELEALKLANSLILRTNIFGWNIQAKHSIAEWILYKLTENTRIDGFKDAYFSSIYTFDLAVILEKAIEKDLIGIYNCGSCDSMSKYEFALLIARLFHLNQNLVNPISIDDHKFKARRGKNLSLNVGKLALDLNCNFPKIHDSVKAFYNDFQSGLNKKIGRQMPLDKVTKPFLNYGKQSIDEDDIHAVVEALQSKNLTQGPKIADFEEELCRYTGARFAVACNSGTSALHMTCLAAGVGPGDEVITSPITFVASANCAVYCGAKPVFADIEAATYNISPAEIEKKITGKTRAIIPVHFAGQSCDMESIQEMVRSAEKKFGRKIYIIEDACHALGSLYKETKAGACTYSDMTVTSFHPVKHITTGEGGVVFTKDPVLLKKIRLLRSHGITSDPADFLNEDIAFQRGEFKERNPWYYEQITLGYNYRITDIQCALGVSQIKRLDEFCRRRHEIVNKYNDAFRGMKNIDIPFESQDCDSNFHLYVLLFNFENIGMERAPLMMELRKQRIQTQVHYIPVHLQPYYKKTIKTKWGDYPQAEKYYQKCLSIPLFPAMLDEEVDYVIETIKALVCK